MKKIWDKWKEIAEVVGNLQAIIVFSLLYFILITPFGIISNLFKDFFKTKTFLTWEKVDDNVSSLEKLKKQ